MKAIVWVERTQCNNKCNYCIVYRKNIPQADVTWQQWVEKINALKPQILDITGGEPFLNPHIVDIIKGLDPDIKLGLTTNLTQDMTRFINEIPASRLINMTLSYHPSQVYPKDAFMGKAMMLLNRKYPICVNFVTYPEQLWLLPELKQQFEARGIRFHVDPYATNPLFPAKMSEVEEWFLKQYVGEDRSYRLDKDRPDLVKCSAGQDYMILQPDGSVFRCMSMVWSDQGSMGNIFDPAFRLNDNKEPCNKYKACGGCDMDKVTVET